MLCPSNSDEFVFEPCLIMWAELDLAGGRHSSTLYLARCLVALCGVSGAAWARGLLRRLLEQGPTDLYSIGYPLLPEPKN